MKKRRADLLHECVDCYCCTFIECNGGVIVSFVYYHVTSFFSAHTQQLIQIVRGLVDHSNLLIVSHRIYHGFNKLHFRGRKHCFYCSAPTPIESITHKVDDSASRGRGRGITLYCRWWHTSLASGCTTHQNHRYELEGVHYYKLHIPKRFPMALLLSYTNNYSQKFDPLIVLELGTYCEYSAVRIASQLHRPRSKRITVEMSPENFEIARQIIDHAGLSSKVQLMQGKFEEQIHKGNF
eukprot:Gb_29083 [translate_table: standard]